MKRIKTLNETGAVSLLSILLFSIIITIVTTAYVRVVVSQQKNALNYDLTNRAYYAAEAGVQDAVRLLKSNPARQTNKEDCTPFDNLGTLGSTPAKDYGLSYTCQLVIMNPPSLEGKLGKNWSQSATMRIQPANISETGPFTIRISWSKKKEGGSSNPVTHVARNWAAPDLPPDNQWYERQGNAPNPNRPIHPLLRATIVSRPIDAASRDQTQQRVTFLNPTTVTHSSTQTFSPSDTLESQRVKLFTNASCYNSDSVPAGFAGGDYSCYQDIKLDSRVNEGYNFASQAIYLRLSSFYGSTNFNVKLISGSGTTEQSVSLKNSLVTIDVTGKAGSNVFRRIQQDASIDGDFSYDSTPDASIVAGEGICKNYTLGANSDLFTTACVPGL